MITSLSIYCCGTCNCYLSMCFRPLLCSCDFLFHEQVYNVRVDDMVFFHVCEGRLLVSSAALM